MISPAENEKSAVITGPLNDESVIMEGGPELIADELAKTKAAPYSFGDGLALCRSPDGGGLCIYRGGKIVLEIESLDPDELSVIRQYLKSAQR